MLNEPDMQKCFGSFLFNNLTLFSIWHGEIEQQKVKCYTEKVGVGGRGQECHFASGVFDWLLYKIFDRKLKSGIPCPLKCLMYHNIVFTR